MHARERETGNKKLDDFSKENPDAPRKSHRLLCEVLLFKLLFRNIVERVELQYFQFLHAARNLQFNRVAHFLVQQSPAYG